MTDKVSVIKKLVREHMDNPLLGHIHAPVCNGVGVRLDGALEVTCLEAPVSRLFARRRGAVGLRAPILERLETTVHVGREQVLQVCAHNTYSYTYSSM